MKISDIKNLSNNMKLSVLFDTSIASENVGDYIIMDAVRQEVEELLLDFQLITLPTHDFIGPVGRGIIKKSEFSLIGGTNILSSNIEKYRQWKFSFMDLPVLRNVVLMGVGWWQYQPSPNWISSIFYNKALSKSILHSVRDSYTERQLRSIGIKNVLNTSCPTMWKLTPEHCANIPASKGNRVVFTLTDYNIAPEHDHLLINTLLANYEEVIFWPQGSGDFAYLRVLLQDRKGVVKVIPPNLSTLNDMLSLPGTDYIGTRLHAGIRALQKKVRTLIIAIDNRAKEKSKDFHIPTLDREAISEVNCWINSPAKFEIRIPLDEIAEWKRQFYNLSRF